MLLKVAPVFPPTKPEDVFGMLRSDGPLRTLEEMEEGVAREAKRRRAHYRK